MNLVQLRKAWEQELGKLRKLQYGTEEHAFQLGRVEMALQIYQAAWERRGKKGREKV